MIYDMVVVGNGAIGGSIAFELTTRDLIHLMLLPKS